MKKWISLLLSLCLCLLAGCGGPDPATPPATEPQTVLTSAPTEEPTQAPTEKPEPDPDEPSAEELLVYTLTDGDADALQEKIDICREAALHNRSEEELDRVFEEMDDAYAYIEEQQGIAYILYCCDQEDEQARERHLHSVELLTQSHDAVMLMLQEIYRSDSRVRDYVFADWTREELAQLESYSSESAELENENENTVVAYQALEEEELLTGIAPYYTSLIANNQKIAELAGYDNYYEYAYDVVYGRDYDTEQVQILRGFVQEYLLSVCEDALYSFIEAYTDPAMTQKDALLVQNFMESSSTSLRKDYFGHYARQLPEELSRDMLHMRRNDRAVFSDKPGAREGAFTMSIGGRPVCYFGPGYDGIMTVTHESGHYCSCLHMDLNSIPMDLAELQAQGNEWMMIHYMKQEMSPAAYRALRDYKMYMDMCTIIISTMVDDFEQRIYENPDSVNFTDEDFDAVADAVCDDYGGQDFISDTVVDFPYYWRMVTMDTPVYYVSYAMSGVASVSLYTVALEDTDRAYEILTALITRAEPELGFRENLKKVNLAGPFEESVYQHISEIYHS